MYLTRICVESDIPVSARVFTEGRATGVPCNCPLTIKHLLIECVDFTRFLKAAALYILVVWVVWFAVKMTFVADTALNHHSLQSYLFQNYLGMQSESIHLAITLLDQYLSRRKVSLQKLQLLGITCLLVAAKFNERFPPTVSIGSPGKQGKIVCLLIIKGERGLFFRPFCLSVDMDLDHFLMVLYFVSIYVESRVIAFALISL